MGGSLGFAAGPYPDRIGVGLGQRQLDRPNLLRLVLPAAALRVSPLNAKRCWCSSARSMTWMPRPWRFCRSNCERWCVGGVRAACGDEKGRQGLLLTALALPEQAAALRAIWWEHSSSLGLRENLEQRWVLPRRAVVMDSPWGPVAAKRLDGKPLALQA